jgi:hypothetical protein
LWRFAAGFDMGEVLFALEAKLALHAAPKFGSYATKFRPNIRPKFG